MRGRRKSSQRQFALRILPLTLFLVFSLLPFSSWGIQSKDGQSVASGNPESASAQTTYASIDDEEVTPETWRTINLEMRKADGSVAKIDLLRPLWWLEEAGAEVGGTIPLSIPEMGIDGDARVLNIGPCKADSRTGDPQYRVVTGKFTHENAIVLDLYFNNSPNKPLGVTPNHPLWSETRNGWVEAGQLKIGEYVKTKDGTAKLTKSSQRSGRHKVYNLEVHKDHAYYVSNLGILAHNSCQQIPGRPFRGPDAPQRAFKSLEKHQGLDPKVASNRLHKLKEAGGLGAADDVAIGRTGDVYNAKTGERLGTLTDKSLGTER